MPECTQCGSYTKFEKGLCYECYLLYATCCARLVVSHHYSEAFGFVANQQLLLSSSKSINTSLFRNKIE